MTDVRVLGVRTGDDTTFSGLCQMTSVEPCLLLKEPIAGLKTSKPKNTTSFVVFDGSMYVNFDMMYHNRMNFTNLLQLVKLASSTNTRI
jgi:hypothetical protein